MKWKLLAIVMVGLVLGADDKKEGKSDKDKLQGDWVAQSWEVDGQAMPAEELKNVTMKVEGDTWTVKLGETVIKGTHKLDATKKPKTLDGEMTEGGSDKIIGIYEIDGDTWKECWAREGKDRPKQFKADADAGHNLNVWKRAKKS
jgi:uncharacterized protein (TIGR03067 family)